MNEITNYNLDIWKGDWGLPSIDIHCLQILAYARFSHIPLTIRVTNNPFKTPRGHLPVLRTKENTLDEVKNILTFFRQNNYSLDFALSPKHCSEVSAYCNMLQYHLYPAIQFVWWIDASNLNGLIRPWYAKALPFPFNFYYPGKFENEAKSLMESLYPLDHDNISSLGTQVYSNAQLCLKSLSNKLGDSKYFFGSYPSTLDAIVYSYLAPILSVPLPHNTLKKYLKEEYTNLVKFVTHISQTYFESDYQEYEKQNTQKMSSNPENDFPNKRRDQIIAGLVAMTAMMSYALLTGIVKVWTKNDRTVDDTMEYAMDEEVDE